MPLPTLSPVATGLPTLVFLDRATIPRHIQLPDLAFAHHWCEYEASEPQQVVDRLLAADVVITNKVNLTRDILVQLPKLKLIAIAATGTNNVDLQACRELNIAVCNVQGYATRSVPEHVVAMLFALRRNLIGYHKDIAAGEWQRHKQFCFFTHPIGDIAGSTMGIIGSGALGQATANLARALGMQVLLAERKGLQECRAGYTPFEQVLAQSDVISLHCPLTDETRNIISSAELALMKANALLINTGRGGLVDEFALVEALKSGQIAGAGVDVFSAEPADMDNPLIAHSHLPNLILTPHVAWGSDSAIQQLATILIDNISAFMRGEQHNRIV